MKNRIIFFMLLCMMSTSFATNQKTSESLELPKEWKFQTGDNADFAKPDFNDEKKYTKEKGKGFLSNIFNFLFSLKK